MALKSNVYVKTTKDAVSQLLVMLRNSLYDPLSRGTQTSDVFTTPYQQTVTLTNTLVKNIISVTNASGSLYYGTDYDVSYGAGSNDTTITFLVTPTTDTTVTYRYGDAFVVRGFARDGRTLPVYVLKNVRYTEKPSYDRLKNCGNDYTTRAYTLSAVLQMRSTTNEVGELLDRATITINNLRQSLINEHGFSRIRAVDIQAVDRDVERKVFFANCTVEAIVKIEQYS